QRGRDNHRQEPAGPLGQPVRLPAARRARGAPLRPGDRPATAGAVERRDAAPAHRPAAAAAPPPPLTACAELVRAPGQGATASARVTSVSSSAAGSNTKSVMLPAARRSGSLARTAASSGPRTTTRAASARMDSLAAVLAFRT